MYKTVKTDTDPLLKDADEPKNRYNVKRILFSFLVFCTLLVGVVVVWGGDGLNAEVSVGGGLPEESVGAQPPLFGTIDLKGIQYKRPDWTKEGGNSISIKAGQHRCHILSGRDIFVLVDAGKSAALANLFFPNNAFPLPAGFAGLNEEGKFRRLFNAPFNLRAGNGGENEAIQQAFDPDFKYNSATNEYSLTDATRAIITAINQDTISNDHVTSVWFFDDAVKTIRTSGGLYNKNTAVPVDKIVPADRLLMEAIWTGF